MITVSEAGRERERDAKLFKRLYRGRAVTGGLQPLCRLGSLQGLGVTTRTLSTRSDHNAGLLGVVAQLLQVHGTSGGMGLRGKFFPTCVVLQLPHKRLRTDGCVVSRKSESACLANTASHLVITRCLGEE